MHVGCKITLMQIEKQEFPYTDVLFDTDARKVLLAGAELVANAVGCTMGPRGKTVLIQQEGHAPVLTKDGVTVSRAVRLADPIQRMGGDLLRDAANRTNEVAGDGTTTATVISYALMAHGFKLLQAGHSAKELCEDLIIAKDVVLTTLKNEARQANDTSEIVNVATISANGDTSIGALIADALKQVGRDGIVTVEDAKGMMTNLDVVEGLQFDRGYLSPYFVTNNDKMQAIYENCRVLITDRVLKNLQEVVPVLEYCQKSGESLLIIADDIEPEVLHTLVLNRVKANLRVIAVKAPGLATVKGHMLEDLATLTGGKVVSSKTGIDLKEAASYLGTVKKTIVGAKATTLVGTGKTREAVVGRIEDLRRQLEDPSLDTDEKGLLRMRLARLAGGVAVIKVGGSTELEMVERRYRIEDALNATRAAIEEGYIEGGGMTLLRIAYMLRATADKRGDLLALGCEEPLRRITENAGDNFEVVKSKIEAAGFNDHGWDAKARSVDLLLEKGIIDPVKVTRTAIENAVSVATAFLSLGAAVYEIQKDER